MAMIGPVESPPRQCRLLLSNWATAQVKGETLLLAQHCLRFVSPPPLQGEDIYIDYCMEGEWVGKPLGGGGFEINEPLFLPLPLLNKL